MDVKRFSNYFLLLDRTINFIVNTNKIHYKFRKGWEVFIAIKKNVTKEDVLLVRLRLITIGFCIMNVVLLLLIEYIHIKLCTNNSIIIMLMHNYYVHFRASLQAI